MRHDIESMIYIKQFRDDLFEQALQQAAEMAFEPIIKKYLDGEMDAENAGREINRIIDMTVAALESALK